MVLRLLEMRLRDTKVNLDNFTQGRGKYPGRREIAHPPPDKISSKIYSLPAERREETM